MSTLANFNTGFGSGKPFWPDWEHRMHAIQRDLMGQNGAEIAHRVPIGPVQPLDSGLRMSAHPDPRLTERQMHRVTDHFVRTRPYTHRVVGDTADGIYMYSPTCLRNKLVNYWKKMVPVKTTSRFVPY